MTNIVKLRKILKSTIERFFGVCNLVDHFIVNSLDQTSVIVDLGAGKGEFSDCILSKLPNCRIISVEPDPFLFHELTMKYEKQNNVEVLNAAATGNEAITGEREFYLGKNSEANSLHKSLIGETNFQSEITVRTVTLEDIFLLFHLEKIDLLKVDIEGEEWNIFENFSKRNFDRILQISVEFHDFLIPSLRARSERSVKMLKEFGYTFISKGTKFVHGSPYYNCLFYDKKRLKWTNPAKYWKIPKRLSDRI